MNSAFAAPSRNCALLGLIVAIGLTACAQDVVDLTLVRTGTYQQTSDAPPLPIPDTADESPFVAVASMGMSSDFLSDPDNLIFVSGVTLQPPTGALRAMDFFEGFGGFVDFQPFASLASLQSSWRAGTYRFTYGSIISGTDNFDVAVTDITLPVPPQLLNFVAAQSLDPTQPFKLNWSPNAPAVGGARVEIYDDADGTLTVHSDPIIGAVNSFTIPAGSLTAGHTYTADIAFTRIDVNDRNSVPSRYVAAMAVTRVPLKPGGGTPQEMSITSITTTSNGEVVLTISCTPGTPVNIDQSPSLQFGWETIRSFTPESSPATVTLSAANLGNLSFLRATQ